MLITNSHLIGTPILSIQSGSTVGTISEPIIDPDTLKIIAFKLTGPLVKTNNILDINSIREYSQLGMVIDDIDELVSSEDVVKISKVLALNFDLIGLRVETKKHSKLGKITGYTLTSDDYIIQQIIVHRPIIKALVDPELTISRKEIVEITDYKVIVKDEEKTLKSRAENEDFIPNFVNPFRKQEVDYNPSETDDD